MRGLKSYISRCFKMIGEALRVSIPPCGGRMDDVSVPRASPPGPSCPAPADPSAPSTSAAGSQLKHTRRQPTIPDPELEELDSANDESDEF